VGTRHEKRRGTRERVAATAIALFRAQGYEATTVEQIAAEAGVSPRSFYRYFEAKDGVLGAMGIDAIDKALERLGRGEPTVLEITEALAAVLEEELEDPSYAHGLHAMREDQPAAERMPVWRHRYAERLAGGLAAAAGSPRPTYVQRVRAHTAVHCLAIAIDELVLHRPEVPLHDLLREAIDALAVRTA
jgi:AcrR family transcriptional regulator